MGILLGFDQIVQNINLTNSFAQTCPKRFLEEETSDNQFIVIVRYKWEELEKKINYPFPS